MQLDAAAAATAANAAAAIPTSVLRIAIVYIARAAT